MSDHPSIESMQRERGTIRRGDGRKYAAVRDPASGYVWATRGHDGDESYFGTTKRLAATFEPERLHFSGSVTTPSASAHTCWPDLQAGGDCGTCGRPVTSPPEGIGE